MGYHPEMILAGRRLNDNMALHVAERVALLMAKRRLHVKGSRILVMGLTFKENCPDVRNSKVADLIHELEKYGARVDAYDPWVDAAEVVHEYGITPVKKIARGRYDAIVVAVSHDEFRAMGIAAIRKFAKRRHVLFDIKYLFGASEVDGRL
jgi:UDP-N-acetyl-D-galactosamine dehydrogenase